MTMEEGRDNRSPHRNTPGSVHALFSLTDLAAGLARPGGLEPLCLLIPEVEEMRGVGQNLYHRFDVLTHSLKALESIEGLMASEFSLFGDFAPLISRSLEGTLGSACPRKVLLKMAALFHDLGKPRSSAEHDGRITFIGHESLGAQMIGEIAGRLNFLSRERAYLELMVKNHLRLILLPEQPRVTGRAVRRLIQASGEFLPDLALLSRADIEATAGDLMTGERVLRHYDFLMRLLGEFYFGKREKGSDMSQ
jgi:putative nucleotidyltransferase with HDIG domain